MRLAALDITPINTDVLLYTVPAARGVVLSLNLVNRGAGPARVRVALTDGAVPGLADWIEYDTPMQAASLSGGSVLERTGIALGAGQRIYVRTDVATVSAVAYGIVEAV